MKKLYDGVQRFCAAHPSVTDSEVNRCLAMIFSPFISRMVIEKSALPNRQSAVLLCSSSSFDSFAGFGTLKKQVAVASSGRSLRHS